MKVGGAEELVTLSTLDRVKVDQGPVLRSDVMTWHVSQCQQTANTSSGMKTAGSLVPLFILSSFSPTQGLQIDDAGDVDIIYDDLIDELVAGRAELAGIDVSDYLRDGINEDTETDKLTDLPENLQQLQQQLLQV